MKPKTKHSLHSDDQYIEKWVQEEKRIDYAIAFLLIGGAIVSVILTQAMYNLAIVIFGVWLLQFSRDDEKIRDKIIRSLKTKMWLTTVLGIFAVIFFGAILFLGIAPDYYLFQIYLLIWVGFKSLWDASKMAGFKGTYS